MSKQLVRASAASREKGCFDHVSGKTVEASEIHYWEMER